MFSNNAFTLEYHGPGVFISKCAQRRQGTATRRASRHPIIDALVSVGEDYLFVVAFVLDRHYIIRVPSTLFFQLA